MQQTSKYQFNLVEGSDDFSPTPLNQNMEKVEEALEGMETAIEESYSPGNKPYVVGSYSANGSGVTVELGFKPSLVIISGERYSTDTEDMMLYTVIATADSPGMVIEFTNTGFRTLGVGSYAPYLCDKRAYRYIAFR